MHLATQFGRLPFQVTQIISQSGKMPIEGADRINLYEAMSYPAHTTRKNTPQRMPKGTVNEDNQASHYQEQQNGKRKRLKNATKEYREKAQTQHSQSKG